MDIIKAKDSHICTGMSSRKPLEERELKSHKNVKSGNPYIQ